MQQFFNKIIAPHNLETFFEQYHEKDILHISRNDAGYYEKILTPEEISEYLDRQDIFYPSIRMVQNGKEIPSAQYTLKAVPIGHHKRDGIINTEKMFGLFNGGATMVVQAGQRYFDHLSRCCLELSQKFNAPVQANLYITPQKSQGFNPHWDTHDVFVLQISGTKTWHLYGFEKELPTKNQSFVSKDYKKEPIRTIQMMPGDFLYLPRGYVHDAMADEGISSHITIGILSFTWIRFFNEIMPQLEDIKAFREAVPFWKDNLEELIQEKIATLKESLGSLDSTVGIQRLNRSYHKAQPQPLSGYFDSLLQLNRLRPQSRLRLNDGILFTLSENGTGPRLQFFDKTIQLTQSTKPVLEYILAQKDFTLEELPDLSDDAERHHLAATLVREGVIYIEQL
ncbi:cupin domain-containing protein [Niabella terrae]